MPPLLIVVFLHPIKESATRRVATFNSSASLYRRIRINIDAKGSFRRARSSRPRGIKGLLIAIRGIRI